MSDLFAVLAILIAGAMGASITRGDSNSKGGFFVLYATGFVLLCAFIGYITGINPGKIMTICGLAFIGFIVGMAFFGSEKK